MKDPQPHPGHHEQHHTRYQHPRLGLSAGGDDAERPGSDDGRELQGHNPVIGREEHLAEDEEEVHYEGNPETAGVVPSRVPAPPAENLRFQAQGGLVSRIRAGMAVPFLVTGSRLVGLAGAMRARRAVHALERVLGRLAEHLAGIRLDVVGLEKVDPSQRYVVVALHEGFADALALLRLPLRLRFAARDELFEWPALGRYLEAARHVRVDTLPSVASARRFFREAGEALDSGDSLVVFAQGTILGVEIAFRDSPLRLARRFGCSLLPVVLTGSHRVWEHPYSPALRFGQEMSVRVLDPLPADQLEPASFRGLERNMKRVALSEEVASARRFRPERDGWWDGYPYEIDPDFPALKERVAAHRRLIRSDSRLRPPAG